MRIHNFFKFKNEEVEVQFVEGLLSFTAAWSIFVLPLYFQPKFCKERLYLL